jgi:GAF domain-containing protein
VSPSDQILEEIRSARNLAALIATIRSTARPLVGADGITFVLRDGGFCFYADEDAISPLWKGERFPMDQCISGWVMEHGEPVVIRDVYADSRIPADVYRKTFVQSLAMMPVGGRQPVAAIGAYWATRHAASEEEIERLRLLAHAASVVLEHTCPKCHRTGFVRQENVVRRGVSSRHHYCGVCDHGWATW